MKKLLFGAFFCALASFNASNAVAGIRTYVSVTGNDANNCFNPSASCSTFNRAIAQAGVDGEVVCLDSGFFGVLAISFPVAVRCDQHIGQTGTNFNSISLSADGVVILDGIDMDLREFKTSAGLNFLGVGTLILRNSSIRNGANGVFFAPTGNAKLVISNTVFESHADAGVRIAPAGAGTFRVDLDNIKSTNNLGGVAVVANAGEIVNLEMRNSLIAQNSNYGFSSLAGGNGASNVLIDDSSISNNGGIGVISSGAPSSVRVNRSVLMRNQVGWSAANGASLLSYGNNAVNSVTATGGPTGTVGLQ